MAFDTRLLSGLGVLAAVIETGSFARAAGVLGMSDSGVSRSVARLEARVGVRLLDRTTRSLHLTDEGRLFHEQIAPLLTAIEEAAARASGGAERVRGRLRVDVDPYFSRLVLAPRLPELIARHPDLELELITRDKVGDLVADGVDLALRFGDPPSTALIARRLLETRILTVASPAYLERHGTPKKPADLANHACIQFRDPVTGRPFEWEFRRKRQVVPVATRGPLTLSDVGTMLDACLAGAGVAQVMEMGIGELLRAGRLVSLFPDWPDELFPLQAFYPSRHNPPAKVKAFLRFCLEVSGQSTSPTDRQPDHRGSADEGGKLRSGPVL